VLPEERVVASMAWQALPAEQVLPARVAEAVVVAAWR